jgi:hypothetical protein
MIDAEKKDVIGFLFLSHFASLLYRGAVPTIPSASQARAQFNRPQYFAQFT